MQIDEPHQETGADAARTYECRIPDSETLRPAGDDCDFMEQVIAEWSQQNLGYVPEYWGEDFEDTENYACMVFEKFHSEANALLFRLYWSGHTGCTGYTGCGCGCGRHRDR